MEKIKRIAIIDDEPDAREALQILLKSYCPDIEICGEADSVESGYKLIRQTKPHCILLDISMEDGNGFDLLDKFPQPSFQVIFTTAFDEFALKAFRYHALDYLLKPINAVELAQTIDRVKITPPDDYSTRVGNLLESARTRQLNKITLSSQEGILFLNLDQIVHLESEGSYTTFYLLNKDHHVVSRPMKEFETLLPEDEFFKIHQSHIINLSFVKKILKEDGGYVLMEDGFKAPIARRRKDEFLEKMRQ